MVKSILWCVSFADGVLARHLLAQNESHPSPTHAVGRLEFVVRSTDPPKSSRRQNRVCWKCRQQVTSGATPHEFSQRTKLQKHAENSLSEKQCFACRSVIFHLFAISCHLRKSVNGRKSRTFSPQQEKQSFVLKTNCTEAGSKAINVPKPDSAPARVIR